MSSILRRASVMLLALFALSYSPLFAWTQEQNLTSDNPGSTSPAIAIGPTGRIHVVYAHQPSGSSSMRLYYTYWTGSGWAVPQDLPGPNYKEPGCDIAVDGNDNVHVTGIYRYDGTGASAYTVYYWKYNGSSWTGPVMLSSGTGDDHDTCTSANIAVDKNNEAHVVWAQNGIGKGDIMYRRTIGGVWQPRVNISNNYSPNTYGSASPDIAVDASPGTSVHITWHDEFSGYARVYYTKSTDLGQTWIPSSQWAQISSDDYGKSPKIVLDKSNYPNIWWTNSSSKYLGHRRWTGSAWTPISNWGTGWFQSAAFDASNRMHYLYTAPDPDGTIELFYRTYDYLNFTSSQYVSTGSDTLKVDGADIALDSSGVAHALWIERKGAWPGLSYIFYSKGVNSTPPGPVTSFAAAASSQSQISLSWKNPSDSNYYGTVIRYRFDGYPVDPYDGNVLITKYGVAGGTDSAVHSGLQSGQTVYYTAFAFNRDFANSIGANASTRTISGYNDHGLIGNGARPFALAAAPDGTVYTGTDGLDTLRGSFGKFNPSTGIWQNLNLPYTGRVLSLLVHSSGKIYGCQGGGDKTGTEGDGGMFWSYNPSNGQYTALYNDPAKQVQGDMAEGPDGRVWFGDGYLNLLVYDPKLPVSGTNPKAYVKPASVSGVLVGGIELASNGSIYVAWGAYHDSTLNVDVAFDLFKLNPTTGAWTRITLPGSMIDYSCPRLVTGNDGYIYGITTRAEGHIFRLDPSNDSILDYGSQFPTGSWGANSKHVLGGGWAANGRLYWGSSQDIDGNAHMFFFDRAIPTGSYNGSRDNGTLPTDTRDIHSAVYSKGRVYLGVRMDNGTPRLWSFDVAGTAPSPAVGTLRTLADGSTITLNTKVVTGAFGDHFYIEEPDRTAGIKVVSNAVVAVGSMVSLTGTLQTVDGERSVKVSSIGVYSGGNGIPDPFAWNIRTVGGGVTGNVPALFESYGLNNVGLLGRVAGTVIGLGDDSCFYLDDGSGTPSDEGFTGIKIVSDAPVSVGQKVIITGISSVALDIDSRTIRQLKTRSMNDVRILQ